MLRVLFIHQLPRTPTAASECATGCVLTVDSEDTSEIQAWASDTCWSLLANLASLRCLVIGLGNPLAAKTLSETHQDVLTSLGERLMYHRVAYPESMDERAERRLWETKGLYSMLQDQSRK